MSIILSLENRKNITIDDDKCGNERCNSDSTTMLKQYNSDSTTMLKQYNSDSTTMLKQYFPDSNYMINYKLHV